VLDSYACCHKGGPSVLKFLYFFAILSILVLLLLLLYFIIHSTLSMSPKPVMPEWIYLVNNVSSSHILCWRCFII